MTPVEQTKSSCGSKPILRAASWLVRWEAASPGPPVEQLALPAFTTTARMRPLDAARFRLERTTGVARDERKVERPGFLEAARGSGKAKTFGQRGLGRGHVACARD